MESRTTFGSLAHLQEEALAGGHCVALAETWRNFGMLLLEVRDAAGNVSRFRLY